MGNNPIVDFFVLTFCFLADRFRRRRKAEFQVGYVCPLSYWFLTRLLQGSTFFIFQRLSWQVALILLVGGRWKAVAGFLLAWVAFKSIYEFGYFVNDFWSQAREGEGQAQGTKGMPGWAWLTVAASRLVFSWILMLGIQHLLGSGLPLNLIIAITAAAALVFLAHNLTMPRNRWITFFLLQTLKGLLVIPFILQVASVNPLQWILVVAIPALPAALSYVSHKKKTVPLYWGMDLNMVINQIRFNILLILLVLFCFWLMHRRVETRFIQLIIIDVILIWFISVATFIKASLGSLRPLVLRHVHTCYSHDCTVALGDIPSLATRIGYQTCFITDHAEDFNEQRYRRLADEIRDINQAGEQGACRLVSGLEYPVCRQHILACDLRCFVAVGGEPMENLRALQVQAGTLVWAHPLVAVRKLYRPSYWVEMIKLGFMVHGVEWSSGKSDRQKWYFTWRHLVVAFLVHHIWPQKTLHFGADLHTLDDWKRLGPHSLRKC